MMKSPHSICLALVASLAFSGTSSADREFSRDNCFADNGCFTTETIQRSYSDGMMESYIRDSFESWMAEQKIRDMYDTGTVDFSVHNMNLWVSDRGNRAAGRALQIIEENPSCAALFSTLQANAIDWLRTTIDRGGIVYGGNYGTVAATAAPFHPQINLYEQFFRGGYTMDQKAFLILHELGHITNPNQMVGDTLWYNQHYSSGTQQFSSQDSYHNWIESVCGLPRPF